MNKKSIFVNLSINETIKLIKEEIENRYMTCNIIDKYKQVIDDKTMYVLILEKYFMRVSNRITITVVIDDFNDKTRIHFKAAGGGSSYLMRFDWGAAKKFEEELYSAFKNYIIK